ncbi:MAG: hypothetical protein DSZ09_02420 [Sulfurovum sp.]|nr:MAG: hypothetical protein DSZ09_02420 [Sulfurovum sp.]
MNIKTSQVNQYTKVSIEADRLDVANMQTMKEEIQDILNNHHKIILDLSAVSFLDSSGLSILISILKQLNKVEDAQLKLCGLNPQPYELMQITQLYNVFDIVTDCDSIV